MWILPVPALYAFACRAALCAATSFWANKLMMNMKLVHSETCSDQSIHIAQTRPKLQFKQIASSDLDKPDILWPPHAMRGTACSGCIMFSPCPSCCLSWCLSRAGVYPDFLTGGNLCSLRGWPCQSRRSKFKYDTNVHCVNDKQYMKYRQPLD